MLATLGILFKLIDPVQVASILTAELPLAVFVWYWFQRREARRRTVLDTVDMAKAMADYDHLRIIFHDTWDFADYPEKQYYVLNLHSNPRRAYFVPSWIRVLEKGGLITREHRFKSLDSLKEYLAEVGAELILEMPEVNALKRTDQK